MVQPLWKAIWQFLKKLKIGLPHDSPIPLLGIYPKELKTATWTDTYIPMFVPILVYVLPKQALTHVCSSNVHSSQRIKATQVFMDGWKDKWNVICTTVKCYSVFKRKKILTLGYSVDESWGYYAQWNKPVTHKKLFYVSTYTRYLQWTNLQRQKEDCCLLEKQKMRSYCLIGAEFQFFKM